MSKLSPENQAKLQHSLDAADVLIQVLNEQKLTAPQIMLTILKTSIHSLTSICESKEDAIRLSEQLYEGIHSSLEVYYEDKT